MAVFLKSKRDKDMVRWRCVKRSCSATLYTFGSKVVNEENILLSDQDRHNHMPCNDSDINRQMVSTICKRKASEELFIQPKKIILKELAQTSQLADGLTSNDFNTIRKDIGKWIKYTFGLLYLGLEEVSDCFVEDLMPECPTDERVTKYCDYLVNNYISEDSTFPPCLWACNSASILLTTNACESFHSFFNDHFYSNSPSILSWLNVVKNFVQTDTYIKINSVIIPKTSKDANIIKKKVHNQKQITRLGPTSPTPIISPEFICAAKAADELDDSTSHAAKTTRKY
ncbi:hypothetical protein AGLY_003783 [Aphis glycines]|uniref:FLYWCH-type domain-containing protein n=1 Tax=Aphis glycines TaxID=307491 RepID=A0A6G0TZB7_APHGL|nr:hypothetical protein AGLY_003783 [Aphis glycines]